MTKRFSLRLLTLLLSLALLLGALTGCELPELPGGGTGGGTSGGADTTLASVPPFTDKAFVELNGGVPSFTEEEITTKSFEYYSDLDALGRCGVTFACIGRDLMPTEPRGSIGQVKPSGWKTVKYDIVDGKYLYNRCHLIGYQLTGENANEKNLITGTRYLNIDGMLTFENMVADYIKETGNHVMYRVTPIFVGDELVARGVVMEGYSVEDKGEGISFHVFSYNCQPGITIDYATGESHLMTEEEKAAAKNNQGNQDLSGGKTEPENPTTPDTGTKEDPAATEEQVTMVLNTKTKKYHRPDCASCKTIKAENREEYTGTLLDLQEKGYSPCGSCKPDESKTDNAASGTGTGSDTSIDLLRVPLS